MARLDGNAARTMRPFLPAFPHRLIPSGDLAGQLGQAAERHFDAGLQSCRADIRPSGLGQYQADAPGKPACSGRDADGEL